MTGRIVWLASLVLAAQAQTLLVLNKSEATVAFVDVKTNRVTGRAPTGAGPHEIAVDAQGRFAYVGNYGTANEPGATISVIDLAARKEARKIELGALRRPHGIAFSEGKVYFTAEANRLLARYDPATNLIDWLMGTGQAGTHMVLANRDGSQLYASNIGSGSVTVFDRVQGPAGWNLTVVPVGQGPEGLDLSPDGRELWVAHSRDGGVSVIDVASKRVTQTFDAGTKRSNRLKFTPDGKRVFISDLDAGELLALERANPKEVKRIPLGRMVEGIFMAPGGSRAYVAVAGDNHVAVIDLASLQVTARIETGAAPDGMAWVPAR